MKNDEPLRHPYETPYEKEDVCFPECAALGKRLYAPFTMIGLRLEESSLVSSAVEP
jgi:hypothetical protein